MWINEVRGTRLGSKSRRIPGRKSENISTVASSKKAYLSTYLWISMLFLLDKLKHLDYFLCQYHEIRDIFAKIKKFSHYKRLE